jgi:LPXTG-motif cell wall-anchored protein
MFAPLTVTNYVLQLVDMSTPDTTPEETTVDTIPGGGADQVTYPPTTETGVVVATGPPVTIFDPRRRIGPEGTSPSNADPTEAEVVVVDTAAPTSTVAVVAVRPTLPTTGAGDAASIGMTGGLLFAAGAVAMLIARRRGARV